MFKGYEAFLYAWQTEGDSKDSLYFYLRTFTGYYVFLPTYFYGVIIAGVVSFTRGAVL